MSWLALALTPGVGPVRLAQVRQLAGDEPPSQAIVAEALGPNLSRAYAQILARNEEARVRAAAAKSGAVILGIWEPAYPENLLNLPQPPTVLFLRGQLPTLASSVAIVGTRKATGIGIAFARRTASELAQAGFTVVSGLALGIDAAAHQGALAGGGRTLAVLGSGLDRIYPSSHRALAAQIDLASEFPFGTGPRPEFFPRRNRIVAALARAILVVEAPEHSGALITAKTGLELGREVLAVPGRPSDPNSQGCNALIRDGAQLIQSAAEIIELLGAHPKPALVPDSAVYRALCTLGEALPETLAATCGVSPPEVLAELAVLELTGAVKLAPGGRYIALLGS